MSRLGVHGQSQWVNCWALELPRVARPSGRTCINIPLDSNKGGKRAVYVNWLLTQKTQDLVAQSSGFNSRRRDVAPSDPDGVIDPARLTELYSVPVRAGAAVPRAGPGARDPATPLRRPWTPISPTGRG